MVEDKEDTVQEDSEQKEESQPIIVEFMGKKFDVSTEKGRIEQKAWADAFGYMHGRQTNELGEKRKFYDRFKAVTDTKEFGKAVQEAKDSGDTDRLAELLLVQQQNFKSQLMEDLRKERANEKVWKKYFDSRKGLVDQLDEDYIKDFSEKNLGIFQAENPFEVLDSYWLPKMKSQKEFSEATPVEVETTADIRSARKVSAPTKKEQEPEEFDVGSILDENRKRNFSSK